MPVNQNDSMSATAIIGYHLYISNDLNTLLNTRFILPPTLNVSYTCNCRHGVVIYRY